MLGALGLHAVIGEETDRVVAGMGALGEPQHGNAVAVAQRHRDHRDVGEAVALADVALEVEQRSRVLELDRQHVPVLADLLGGKQRVVAVVGADIDERHAGPQDLVQEGELVGLERAADVEAEAVVVAQHHVDRGAAVPAEGHRHLEPAARRLP